MIFVAIVLAVALVAVAFVFAGLLESQRRAHARREDLLVNQLLHATGRTWTPPPAADPPPAPEPRRTVRSPEQVPEHEWDQDGALAR